MGCKIMDNILKAIQLATDALGLIIITTSDKFGSYTIYAVAVYITYVHIMFWINCG
jgi:hypothetical protein